MEEFKDRTLQCVDCGQDFVFTAGEQGFFTSKRLSTPKRCHDCRIARRVAIKPDPRTSTLVLPDDEKSVEIKEK